MVIKKAGGLAWDICTELIDRLYPLYCVEYINKKFISTGMREIITSINGRDWFTIDVRRNSKIPELLR